MKRAGAPQLERSTKRRRLTSVPKYFDCNREMVPIAEVDTTWGSANEISPPGLGALFTPFEGFGIESRIAKKVLIKGIRIWYTARTFGTQGEHDVPQQKYLRVLLVRDKQSNGGTFITQDVLGTTAAQQFAIDYMTNVEELGKYEILADDRILINPHEIGYSYPPTGLPIPTMAWSGICYNGEISVTFPGGLKTEFNDNNAGDVSDTVDNSFYLLAAVEQYYSANPDPDPLFLSYQCRTTFYDASV